MCANEEIYCVGEQVMEDNCVCNCEQEPPPKCALDLASKLCFMKNVAAIFDRFQ